MAVIKDRFVIRNYLPMRINICGREVQSMQEITMGFIDGQSRKNLPITIETAIVNIDLTGSSQKAILQRVYLSREGDSERMAAEIMVEVA